MLASSVVCAMTSQLPFVRTPSVTPRSSRRRRRQGIESVKRYGSTEEEGRRKRRKRRKRKKGGESGDREDGWEGGEKAREGGRATNHHEYNGCLCHESTILEYTSTILCTVHV